MDDDAPRPRSGSSGARFRTPHQSRSPDSTLPDSALFALWFSAWCGGSVSLDETRDAIVGDDAAHDVIGLDEIGGDGSVPLILALGRLRAERATGAGLALPVPGDPLGLAGPPAFNAEALEAGEAVVLAGADLGLVPVRAGRGVVWRCLPAQARRQVPDLAEADTELRRTLPAVAERLADLDVARWAPAAADALAEQLAALRPPHLLAVPAGTAARVQQVAAMSTRCRAIVDLALADDGGAVNALDADRRRDVLRDLDRAARRALVAACSLAPPG